MKLRRHRHLAGQALRPEVADDPLISACDPPGYFVDEQVEGPFKIWRHAHHFEPDGNGGTRMRDIIDFAAPLGPLGAVAELTVLRWYMPRLIRVRNGHLKAAAA